MEHLQYPNESEGYRIARNRLLEEEIKLRAQIEAVAARRRALPLGGEVPWDYMFERIGDDLMPQKVRMRVSGRTGSRRRCAVRAGAWGVPFVSPLRDGPICRVVLAEIRTAHSRFPTGNAGYRGDDGVRFRPLPGRARSKPKTIACGTPDGPVLSW